MEPTVGVLLGTAVVVIIVAVIFCSLIVPVMALVVAACWCVGSVALLMVRFGLALRDRHLGASGPAMLFYLVAPTSVVLLGLGGAQLLDAPSYVPVVDEYVRANLHSGWVVGAAILGGLALFALQLSGLGVYVASFAWAHAAYRERRMVTEPLLPLAILFLTAFTLLPFAEWLGLFSL